MLRLKNSQLSLWDEILPPELRTLSEELTTVDGLLDDERIMAPFLKRFDTRIGRPTVPVETYLRMMYLRSRYGLGYEVLVREVSDSIQWRRFCRIALNDDVPHSTTLIKLTRRYGPDTLQELNHTLVEKAREKKVIRGRKLRVDTTVLEADIHYPTDASLLSDGIRVLSGIVKKLKKAGIAPRTKMPNRTRSAKKRIFEIFNVLRRRTGNAYEEVRKITARVVKTAEDVVSDARRVLMNAGQFLRRRPDDVSSGVKALVGKLGEYIGLTERVISQTREVQQGNRSIPERVVSLFDPEARPICKRKLRKPTEFGRTVLIQETGEGIITGYEVLDGAPNDETLLVGAVEEHIESFGRPPKAVSTDRGFSSRANEKALAEAGVERVCIPWRGKRSEARKSYERQGWFVRLKKWRAGVEGVISVLKRKYGLRRSGFRGTPGAKVWVGMGIFAYNLKMLSGLL